MTELADMLDQLKAAGVRIAWTQSLESPAVWAWEQRVLILSAEHLSHEHVSACLEVLDEVRAVA